MNPRLARAELRLLAFGLEDWIEKFKPSTDYAGGRVFEALTQVQEALADLASQIAANEAAK